MKRMESERKSGSPSLELKNEEENSFAGLQPNVGLLRQLKLFVELGAIRKTEDKTSQQYTSKIRDVHKKLTKSGVAISDHALALIMLRGLPMYRYEGLVLKLARDEEKLSSTLVESRLTEEELRVKKDSDLRALKSDKSEAKIRQRDNNARVDSNAGEVVGEREENKIRRVQSQKENSRRSCRNSKEDQIQTCQKICRSCDDINLNARPSPKFKEDRIFEEKRKVSKDCEKENKKAKMCSCQQLKNYWILDSGAAEHGTFHKDYMEDFEFVGGDICMANGARLSVEGEGSVKLSLDDECGGGNLVLDSVRYIPELETNLISMGSLDESGMTLLIRDGKAEVHDGEKVLFTAYNEHNVFVVKTKEPADAQVPNKTAGWRRFSMNDGTDQLKNTRANFYVEL